MDSRSLLAVLVTAALVVGVFAPVVAANSTTVELDRALDDQQVTDSVSFTFEAEADEEVSATESVTLDGSGDVTAEFSSWSGGGDSGSSSSWRVEEGETYTVTYDVIAVSGASEGTHSDSVTVSGDGTSHSETLSVSVELLDPEFGFISDASTEIVFEDDSDQSGSVSVDVPNDGDGVMVPEDVDLSGEPAGIDASVSSVPNTIDGNSEGTVDLSVTADESVDEGTYSFSGTISDNLGNSESFDVSVTVRKPPVASVSSDEAYLGDVLVGESNTTTVRIDEAAGFEGLDGVSIDTSPSADGTLQFDGGSSVSTGPGGYDTVEATAYINEEVEQHENVSWTGRFTPDDEYAPTYEREFEARVIYPAELGDIEVDPETFVFDEPRTTAGEQTQTQTVEIPNEGDLEMDVQSIDANVDDLDVDATVIGEPDTVEGLDSEEVLVELVADPETPEGTYTLELTVDTDEAGSAAITREFDVEHGIEMTLDETDVNFGEVTVTDQRTRSIDVAERLEYRDLSGVTVEQVEGPDDWLTIATAPPPEIDAGDSAPLVLELAFDTDAEPYEEYTWVLELDADGVESRTVEIHGVARLLSVEDVVADLESQGSGGGWQADVAGPPAESLPELEDRIRAGESIDDGDVQRAIASARSTGVLIDSVETAQQRQADGEYDDAQPEVVSALATHNLLVEIGEEIEDEQLRTELLASADAADEPVDGIVDEQERHYRAQLDDTESTVLDRAQATQQLAELAELRGDDETAATLRADSEAEFERYGELVGSGIDDRQDARDRQRAFEANATLSVLGQPFVLNPTRLDEVTTHADDVRADYDDSVAAFEDAGASSEAAAAADERSGVDTQLTITVTTLYGVTALLGGGFLVLVVRLVRNSIAYARDAQSAATGEFLV